MARKGDIQWWVQEAEKYPEQAVFFLRQLAQRLETLEARVEQLRAENLALREGARQSRGDEVTALQEEVKALRQLLHEQDASAGPSVLLVGQGGQLARFSLERVRRAAQERRPLLAPGDAMSVRALLVVRPHDDVLLLGQQGHGHRRALRDVPMSREETSREETGREEGGTGAWASTLADLQPGEWIATAAVIDATSPRFWTVATRRGYVQRYVRAAVERAVSEGQPVLRSTLLRDAGVAFADGTRRDVLLVTRWGRYIRFPQHTIETLGSVWPELEQDDLVVAALGLEQGETLLALTGAGYAVRRPADGLPARAKLQGQARPLLQCFDALSAFVLPAHAELLAFTASGRFVVLAPDEVPLSEKADRGTRLPALDGQVVQAAALIEL